MLEEVGVVEGPVAVAQEGAGLLAQRAHQAGFLGALQPQVHVPRQQLGGLLAHPVVVGAGDFGELRHLLVGVGPELVGHVLALEVYKMGLEPPVNHNYRQREEVEYRSYKHGVGGRLVRKTE